MPPVKTTDLGLLHQVFILARVSIRSDVAHFFMSRINELAIGDMMWRFDREQYL